MSLSRTTLKRNIRSVLFVAIGVTLSGVAAKYTAVNLAKPALEQVAERATCRAMWRNVDPVELDLVDPVCSALLKE